MDGAVLCLLIVGGAWAALMTVVFCWQALRKESPAPPHSVEDVVVRARSRNAFFAPSPAPNGRDGVRKVDDGVVNEVQRYLEGEQSAVEQFVSHPSVETLYRRADRRITMN